MAHVWAHMWARVILRGRIGPAFIRSVARSLNLSAYLHILRVAISASMYCIRRAQANSLSSAETILFQRSPRIKTTDT